MKEFPRFRIRKPRGVSGLQLGLVIFLGVAGGYYIWKPLILESTQAVKNKKILENQHQPST